MEDKIYQVLRKHRLPLKKREELIVDLLALFSVTQRSELLKGFCEYLDKNDYYKDPYTGLKIHDFLKSLV